jgi:hypothetical protein
MKRARMCVYLDVELSKWIKDNAIVNYRSFSSFLNKLMLDYKDGMEINNNVKTLKSEIKR